MRGYWNYCNELTWVYRLYAADGSLLYVGLTRNVRERIGVHARQQPWGHLIDHYTYERFEDRESAQEAERIAIHDEAPIHNVVRSAPLSRDCHVTEGVTDPVTVTHQSRGCHATNTSPHLTNTVVAAACGVSGSKSIHLTVTYGQWMGRYAASIGGGTCR